ncbi:MAG: hypothetical protein HQM10_27150, partial [Candidatus Riflebacteria bacterium]|nr:hypothetical protein [Candidatus Riflebacteria bacterium]
VIGIDTGVVGGTRNPAIILSELLTTAETGIGGWGLGVPVAELDMDAFTQAATDCTTNGLYIDGALNEKKKASYWIDQICKACRGEFKKNPTNGKWALYIHKDTASVHTYDLSNMKLIQIGKGNKQNRKNHVTINYRYQPANATFTGTQIREDNDSIAQIGKNQFRGDLQLVRDHTTAGKIADYLLNYDKYSENRIKFETNELPAGGLEGGNVITINRPDLSLNNALYQVSEITKGELYTIDAKSYSADIFSNAALSTNNDPDFDVPVGTVNPPGDASGLELTSGVRIDADGTAVAYIDGTFTPPSGVFLFANVSWGEGANPATWTEIGNTRDGSFRLSPVKHNQAYSFKIISYNQSGASDPITATITTSVDTTVPATPTITAIASLNAVILNLDVSPWPANFSHFILKRAKEDGSGETIIDANFRSKTFTDNDSVILADYTTKYKYAVKAVTRAGVESASYSSWSDAVVAIQVNSKDIAVNAITAEKVAANAVQACHITACTIQTCHISACQIIAKDFRTCCNTGNGTVSGVLFNSSGIQAWNGATKTVDIDASGNVTVVGTMCAACGSIGGWTINATNLKSTKDLSVVGLYCCGSVGHYISDGGDTNSGEWLGHIYNNCAWSGRYGLAVTRGCEVYIFRADTDANGENSCAQIAGWDFNAACIYKGNLVLNSSGSITGCYAACSTGWCISCDGAAEFNNVTVRGTVCACAGCFTGTITSCAGSIGGWCVTADNICRVNGNGKISIGDVVTGYGPSIMILGDSTCYNTGVFLGRCIVGIEGWLSRTGLSIRAANNDLFKVYSCDDGSGLCAQIAGWDFNAACIYKCNLTLNSNGSMIGIGGGNCVIVSSSGISGHDAVLGTTFCIPTNGCRPTFSSGEISYTFFYVQCNAAIITEPGALCSKAGVLINPDGIFASDCTTACPATAKVRISNDGTMYLGDKLCWDGSALKITGDVCATNGTFTGTVNAGCGCIAGWNVTCEGICKIINVGAYNKLINIMSNFSANPTIIVAGNDSGSTYHTFGGDLFNGSWLSNRWGLVLRVDSQNLLQVHACPDGSCQCAQIAGWDFNAACIYKGNLVLNSSGSITGNYTCGSCGWCISCDGNVEFNNATVRGTFYNGNANSYICSCGACLVSFTSSLCEWGLDEFNGTGILNNSSIHLQARCMPSGTKCSGMILNPIYLQLYCSTLGSPTTYIENNLIRMGSGLAYFCINRCGLYSASNIYLYSAECIINTAPTHICSTLTMCSGNIALNGNWLSGDGGNEGVTVDASGLVCTSSSVNLNTESWLNGKDVAGNYRNLIRARGMGYSSTTYPGVHIGEEGNHIALFIDPGSVCGGSFAGTNSEIFLPKITYILQQNSAGTDWINPAIRIDCGNIQFNCNIGIGTGCFCGTGLTIAGCGWATCFYNTSSKSIKCDYTDINILCNIEKMCIQAWKRIGSNEWGIGPYAEEVSSMLGLGTPQFIPSLDGVALRAIQELSCLNKGLTCCISSLESRLAALEKLAA